MGQGRVSKAVGGWKAVLAQVLHTIQSGQTVAPTPRPAAVRGGPLSLAGSTLPFPVLWVGCCTHRSSVVL